MAFSGGENSRQVPCVNMFGPRLAGGPSQSERTSEASGLLRHVGLCATRCLTRVAMAGVRGIFFTRHLENTIIFSCVSMFLLGFFCSCCTPLVGTPQIETFEHSVCFVRRFIFVLHLCVSRSVVLFLPQIAWSSLFAPNRAILRRVRLVASRDAHTSWSCQAQTWTPGQPTSTP